jgi:hypothetical protein
MHVLFQRANSNPFIMRDFAPDYKGVVCPPTFIAASLASRTSCFDRGGSHDNDRWPPVSMGSLETTENGQLDG